MNKAEKYAQIVESKNGSFFNRFWYFHLLRKYKRLAKRGYKSHKELNRNLNPWLIDRLENEGFLVNEFSPYSREYKSHVMVIWKD